MITLTTPTNNGGGGLSRAKAPGNKRRQITWINTKQIDTSPQIQSPEALTGLHSNKIPNCRNVPPCWRRPAHLGRRSRRCCPLEVSDLKWSKRGATNMTGKHRLPLPPPSIFSRVSNERRTAWNCIPEAETAPRNQALSSPNGSTSITSCNLTKPKQMKLRPKRPKWSLAPNSDEWA